MPSANNHGATDEDVKNKKNYPGLTDSRLNLYIIH